ncbi:early nodulin-20-like protein [Cinnamomum micranthum f. kanehirae]|uniref:Early nodulin-20-like protein n=1 Tax=Cinnamomum micranthum f. kanehirae TaxID=337451 RepID=A0A443P389_9MAGN|nr:early nodulin-20-like protein [Cinnamomum micranthum f. kanehirae]
MGTFCFPSTPLILISIILLLFQPSQSKTFVVDGLANWTKANPTVHVGDSLIFKYQQNLLNLYIFRNKGAFDLCNFTQATLLDNGNTQSYTWYPSRLGFFYFSFSNRSVGACEQGEKAAIKVIQKDLDTMASAPGISPSAAPSPTSGGYFPSTPAYYLPLRPHSASSPSPYSTSPSTLPDSGSGIPFINSNPAVPLPTGETDAATIRPLPMSGHGGKAVVGLLQVQMLILYMVWMIWGLTLV